MSWLRATKSRERCLNCFVLYLFQLQSFLLFLIKLAPLRIRYCHWKCFFEAKTFDHVCLSPRFLQVIFSPQSFNHATMSPRFLNHAILSPRVFNHISLSTWFFSLISTIFLPFWILQTYYTNNKFSWSFQFYLPHTFWSGWL